jgi:hypothetical protein
MKPSCFKRPSSVELSAVASFGAAFFASETVATVLGHGLAGYIAVASALAISGAVFDPFAAASKANV